MARASAVHHRALATFTGRAAVTMRRTITVTMFVIAGLVFAFGFSNGWAIGLRLGAPPWGAPLVAPAVDLSVVALLASMQYLRANGVEGRLVGPRLLLIFSGTAALGLNTAHPFLTGAYGQACFFALPALILIGWSEVGPRLLVTLHGTVPGPSPVVPDGAVPDMPAELVARARQLDAAHQQEHGRPITRDRLRAGLRVSNAVAGEVLRRVRDHEGEV